MSQPRGKPEKPEDRFLRWPFCHLKGLTIPSSASNWPFLHASTLLTVATWVFASCFKLRQRSPNFLPKIKESCSKDLLKQNKTSKASPKCPTPCQVRAVLGWHAFQADRPSLSVPGVCAGPGLDLAPPFPWDVSSRLAGGPQSGKSAWTSSRTVPSSLLDENGSRLFAVGQQCHLSPKPGHFGGKGTEQAGREV